MADGMNSSIEGVEAKKTFMYSEADTEFIKRAFGVLLTLVLLLIFTPGWKKSAKNFKSGRKIRGVFATEQYIHGGADLTMNALFYSPVSIWNDVSIPAAAPYGKPIHMG